MIKLTADEIQYCETALWSSNLDDHSLEDFGNPARFIAPWQEFRDKHAALLEPYDIAGCAHDFWLTCNGHGAGYWDGDYPEHGDALTELCTPYKRTDLYVGDDGKIWY